MEEKKYKIYGLVDPRDGQVRYIGQSINPAKRYKNHVSLGSYGSPSKDDWIRNLLDQGCKPDLIIIDGCDTEQEAYGLEGYWICHYHNEGANLLNGEVYTAKRYRDPNLQKRLLARAAVITNRPRIISKTLEKREIENEIISLEEIQEEQDTSLDEAIRLVRKISQGLREGYDPEICAITLDKVTELLSSL